MYNGLGLREVNLGGPTATLQGSEVVAEMVGQIAADVGELLAILIIEEDDLTIAASDDNRSGSHGSEVYDIVIIPVVGGEGERHGRCGEECAGVGRAVVIADGHGGEGLCLDDTIVGGIGRGGDVEIRRSIGCRENLEGEARCAVCLATDGGEIHLSVNDVGWRSADVEAGAGVFDDKAHMIHVIWHGIDRQERELSCDACHRAIQCRCSCWREICSIEETFLWLVIRPRDDAVGERAGGCRFVGDGVEGVGFCFVQVL